MKKILTAYFSASGVTKKAAESLADIIGTDLYEIKPTVVYTSADLDWTDKNSRTTVEMQDKAFRPEISEKIDNMKVYDIIFLCFPIWWYVAPTIINSFLESYDFSGKTIVLFATSGSSGFGKTIDNLKNSVDSSVKLIEGRMLNGNVTKENIEEYIDSLSI